MVVVGGRKGEDIGRGESVAPRTGIYLYWTYYVRSADPDGSARTTAGCLTGTGWNYATVPSCVTSSSNHIDVLAGRGGIRAGRWPGAFLTAMGEEGQPPLSPTKFKQVISHTTDAYQERCWGYVLASWLPSAPTSGYLNCSSACKQGNEIFETQSWIPARHMQSTKPIGFVLWQLLNRST